MRSGNVPIGEVPERLNGAVSKTVVVLWTTVGSNPTLSAGRKILVAVKAAHYRRPQSLGDMVLTDRGLTPEIAQFQLGDLTFNVHTPHYIYSSALVKVLWDICSTISTPITHLSDIFLYVTNVHYSHIFPGPASAVCLSINRKRIS